MSIRLNFIDVYHRSGLYPLPALPAVIGMEGAGRVEVVGDGVTKVAVGDRVAYAGVPPIDISILGLKGSLFLTRPSLMTYTEKREDLLEHARDLFRVVGSGAVKIAVNQSYPLSEAAQTHRDLEGRKTTGSTLLIP